MRWRVGIKLINFLVEQVVGNSLKSLEVSEEKANQRVEEFKRQLKSLTVKLKEAENRAELAEKTVKKLQKEVDRLEGTFLGFDPKKLFSDFFLNINSKILLRQLQNIYEMSRSRQILHVEIAKSVISLQNLIPFFAPFAWSFNRKHQKIFNTFLFDLRYKIVFCFFS